MRYGEPIVGEALDRLRGGGLRPHPGAAAVSAVRGEHDRLGAGRRLRRRRRRMRRMPALRFVDAYHDDPGYIRALAQSINDYWMKNGRPDKLVLSFHGVPRRTLDWATRTIAIARRPARLLATELGLQRRAVRGHLPVALRQRASGSSRTRGRRWSRWRKEGMRRVDVVCPGFVSRLPGDAGGDRAWRGEPTFLNAGGKEFHCIPCLNEHPAWIAALADLALRNLQGWLDAAARCAPARRRCAPGCAGESAAAPSA